MMIPLSMMRELFEQVPVHGVIHIGAHLAEEQHDYHKHGISRIIWIEANHRLHYELLQETVNHIGSSVIFCAAFNEDKKILELNISDNTQSSSLLDFEEHAIEHPQLQTLGFKIDTVIEKKGFDRRLFNFVNIDIQGTELTALQGMEEQLKFLDYVYLEVNSKHLYKDCALISEINEFLEARGFKGVAIKMTNHGWGDALYIRSSKFTNS
ncbi:MAG TPA: FkbM family methyltransferase [Dehalococcoidia bacterium]|nr:FkbM family methyltransferase [Dehalococcoidia bacterium]